MYLQEALQYLLVAESLHENKENRWNITRIYIALENYQLAEEWRRKTLLAPTITKEDKKLDLEAQKRLKLVPLKTTRPLDRFFSKQ